jgi:membrane-associated protease RseP (regulator of RpoE activity)
MGEGGSSMETCRVRGLVRDRLVAATAILGTAISGAGLRADESAAPAALPAFEAGDISIGEPIPLPFKPPAMAPAAASPETPPAAPPPITLPTPPPAVAAPAALMSPSAAVGSPVAAPAPGAPGNGWLGIVVAESTTPGRWKIDRVDAEGPAAAAGIRVGDEVRAINGLPLRNSDDVAQALTVIAPGQQVRLAIARDEQVADVTLAAIQRPPVSRAWVTAATAQEVLPVPAAAAPSAAAAIPPQPATPPAFARDTPTRFASPAAAAPQPERRTAAVEPAGAAAAVALNPARTAAPVASARGRTALGVRTVPIDPGMQARFGLPEASGAYVIGVVGDLPASKAGVPPGSVIVAIDQRPVRSPDELTRLVTAGTVGRPVPLDYVLPGGTSRRAEVVLQTLEQPLEQALLGEAGPTATQVPTLLPQPAPTTARRPANATTDAQGLRDEIRRLEARIESLERRLQAR